MEIISVAGTEAIKELEQRKAQFPMTGHYPILVGDSDDLASVKRSMALAFDPVSTVASSETFDAGEWLLIELDEIGDLEDSDWPIDDAETITQEPIITHLDLQSRKPKDIVFLGLLEIDTPWKAFAYLNWGGWNSCPSPYVHCAIHRRWQDRYGADVVSISSDVVQCVVARPPQSQEEAITLAREQFEEAEKMAVTFFEHGVEKGIEKGRETGRVEGKREIFKLILEDRFGTLPKKTIDIIDAWPEKSFLRLTRLVTQIESLNELKPSGRHK